MEQHDNIILGLDPGTNIMGYGLIGVTKNKLTLINTGVFKLNHFNNHELKIKAIFEKICHLIKTYCPDEVAIETPFFGKNAQSMLKLARVQGAAIAATTYLGLPIKEYAPTQIKKSITGRGQASKEQVRTLVENTLKFKISTQYLDATDAIATAICHFYNRHKNPIKKVKKTKTTWYDVIKKTKFVNR